jgi:hypothetical protein
MSPYFAKRYRNLSATATSLALRSTLFFSHASYLRSLYIVPRKRKLLGSFTLPKPSSPQTTSSSNLTPPMSSLGLCRAAVPRGADVAPGFPFSAGALPTDLKPVQQNM